MPANNHTGGGLAAIDQAVSNVANERDADIILCVGTGRFRSSEQIRSMFDDKQTTGRTE